MIVNTVYGIGGYCEECSPEHDHPLHNIISQEIIEEPEANT